MHGKKKSIQNFLRELISIDVENYIQHQLTFKPILNISFLL